MILIRDNVITGDQGPIRCHFRSVWERRFRVGFWLGFGSAAIINMVVVTCLFPFLK
jgi:hypothetical protein